MEAGTIVLVIVGVALSGALVFVGYLMAGAASSPADSELTIKPAPQNCAQFCMAWQASRMAVCTASAALTAARSWYNTVATNLAAAAAAFAAALAAATAAALIPLLGPVIAGILFGVSATLLAGVVTLTGMLAGASAMVLQRQGAFIGALADEAKARSAVMSSCTSAEVATCFAMPAPC